ncbi:hypothetical protein C8J56DRAFT_560955 [Mycena floridula]|nr:hypothetical protein C8J56DRAFT_560955 [Mycena floridula]
MVRPKSSSFLLFSTLLHSTRARSDSSSSSTVKWSQPGDGDEFMSGNSILAVWKGAETSPSFALCKTADDTCGEATWPNVVKNDDGDSSSANLLAPDVPCKGGYYLKMKDDFGDYYESPSFYIIPSDDTASSTADESSPTSEATAADISTTADESSVTAEAITADPASSSAVADESSTTLKAVPTTAALSSKIAAIPVATPNAAQAPLTISPSADTNNGAPIISAPFSNAPPPSNVLATRIPPPTAAFAIPLSIVGAILLAAGALSARHNRRLGEEQARESEKLKSNSQVPGDEKSGIRDIEEGLAMERRLPLFSGAREPRRVTRQAFLPSSYARSLASNHGAHFLSRSSTRETDRSFAARSVHSLTPSSRHSRHILPSRNQGLYDDDSSTVTGSILGDYMASPLPPPGCLVSAPQRLHVRREATRESGYFGRYLPEEEYEHDMTGMVEVDLFDAVANSLKAHQRQS